MKPGLFMILTMALLLEMPIFAHGGGLNAAGCHNDRKRGTYHCHRSGYSSPATSTALLSTNRSEYDVKSIQILLEVLGYYSGSIDGIKGGDTRRAIRAFTLDQGLSSNISVDRLIFELSEEVSNRQNFEGS